MVLTEKYYDDSWIESGNKLSNYIDVMSHFCDLYVWRRTDGGSYLQWEEPVDRTFSLTEEFNCSLDTSEVPFTSHVLWDGREYSYQVGLKSGAMTITTLSSDFALNNNRLVGHYCTFLQGYGQEWLAVKLNSLVSINKSAGTITFNTSRAKIYSYLYEIDHIFSLKEDTFGTETKYNYNTEIKPLGKIGDLLLKVSTMS